MKLFVPALLIGSMTFALAADPLPPPPAASGPTILLPAGPAASRPSQSPAVKAAGKAIEPGKLRPENPIVPQVVLPSRLGKNTAAVAQPQSGPASGQIDERAARCAAHETRVERERCEATR